MHFGRIKLFNLKSPEKRPDLEAADVVSLNKEHLKKDSTAISSASPSRSLVAPVPVEGRRLS